MVPGAEIVVVPDAPGPLREVPGDRAPDEVDEILDDLLGPADDGGPGVADAVLATVGGAAIVLGLLLPSPLAVGLGVAAVLLGSILPARTLWRRVQRQRLVARQEEVLGAGTPLRVTPGPVADLVGAHRRLFALVAERPDAVGAEERAAAHAAVSDVATVLGGSAPSSAAERELVTERAHALADLVSVLEAASRPTSADGGPDADGREARLAARREVDRAAGGSSADDLRRLADRRRPGSHG
jgi:hypothetical protein